MLCDHVIRRIDPDAPDAGSAGPRLDLMRVAWHECFRRALRARTDGGREVGVLLPVGTTLAHGDVLHEDESSVVVAWVQPCEVFVARPRDAQQTGVVTCELGNLHVPVQVTDAGEVIAPPDGPVLGVLRRAGVPFTREVRRFAPMRSSVTDGWTLAGDMTLQRRPASPRPR